MIKLLEHLPRFYHTSPEVIAYMAAYDPEVEHLYEARDDFFDQLTVDTATWGLARWWEPMVGLKTDPAYGYAYRRAMVVAKMRGHGTATKAMIAGTVESFYNGITEIAVDAPNFHFDILLGGDAFTQFSVDVPGLTTVIDDIKPAHLSYDLYAQLSELVFANRSALHLRDVRFVARFPNFEGDIITFNGGHLFDGTWLFNQSRRGTLTPKSLRIESAFDNRPDAPIPTDIRYSIGGASNSNRVTSDSVSFAFALPGLTGGYAQSGAASLQMRTPVRNTYALSGMLIMDGRYKFDGSWKFDGSRLFDSVYSEEVL